MRVEFSIWEFSMKSNKVEKQENVKNEMSIYNLKQEKRIAIV